MNRRQFKRNPCVRTASVAVLLTLAVASASVVQGATTVKAPLPIITTYAATNAEQTQLTITDNGIRSDERRHDPGPGRIFTLTRRTGQTSILSQSGSRKRNGHSLRLTLTPPL